MKVSASGRCRLSCRPLRTLATALDNVRWPAVFGDCEQFVRHRFLGANKCCGIPPPGRPVFSNCTAWYSIPNNTIENHVLPVPYTHSIAPPNGVSPQYAPYRHACVFCMLACLHSELAATLPHMPQCTQLRRSRRSPLGNYAAARIFPFVRVRALSFAACRSVVLCLSLSLPRSPSGAERDAAFTLSWISLIRYVNIIKSVRIILANNSPLSKPPTPT